MYGNLPNNNEIGMRWFDFYFTFAVPTFIVIRTLTTIDYILSKDFLALAFFFFSIILNIAILALYLPCRKKPVRKYPLNLLVFTVIENCFWMANSILSTITAILSMVSYTYDSSAYNNLISVITTCLSLIVLYIINIVYFIKRRRFFLTYPQNNDTKNEDEKDISVVNPQNNLLKPKSPKSKTLIGTADEIKKYKELLDDGVISQEEFEQKKKQLLNL